MKCPICSGEMEKGVLIDLIAMKVPTQQAWTQKLPSGLRDIFLTVKSRPTFTYACSSCGYLESYLKIQDS